MLLFPCPQLSPACLKVTFECSLAGEGLYICLPLTAITSVKKQETVPSLPTGSFQWPLFSIQLAGWHSDGFLCRVMWTGEVCRNVCSMRSRQADA